MATPRPGPGGWYGVGPPAPTCYQDLLHRSRTEPAGLFALSAGGLGLPGGGHGCGSCCEGGSALVRVVLLAVCSESQLATRTSRGHRAFSQVAGSCQLALRANGYGTYPTHRRLPTATRSTPRGTWGWWGPSSTANKPAGSGHAPKTRALLNTFSEQAHRRNRTSGARMVHQLPEVWVMAAHVVGEAPLAVRAEGECECDHELLSVPSPSPGRPGASCTADFLRCSKHSGVELNFTRLGYFWLGGRCFDAYHSIVVDPKPNLRKAST
jgi:hypothetical protein